MNPEILLVRDDGGYRVLHGYLHLASMLSAGTEAVVDVSGEGKVKVVRFRSGIAIAAEGEWLPLLGPCRRQSTLANLSALEA